ncbi:MAG: hypothetical protein JXA14_10835 [Anaerolineae bacterium]|nr:hypothetical protein [Anaerolineae bacterium]
MKIKNWRGWGEPLLAGLPHLLFVLALEGATLIRYLGSASVDKQVPPLVFFGLIVAALVFAGTQRWPRWSAGWIGYGLVMAQLTPLGPGSQYTITGGIASGIPFVWAGLIFVAQVVAAVVLSLLLARRDWLSGLLMVLPSVPVLWSALALDIVRAEVRLPLLVAIGLVTALLAGGLSCTKRAWGGVGVALAVNLSINLSVAYVATYHGSYEIAKPTVADMVASFGFNLIASSVLITGPVWGWELLERIWRLIAECVRGAGGSGK